MPELTPKQDATIAALLSQPTIEGAAALAGVSERAIYKWLKDAAFQDAYRIARREATQHAIARLQYLSAAAVAVLGQLMYSDKTPAGIRVGAARSILELALRGVELEDVLVRLAALEEHYAQSEH